MKTLLIIFSSSDNIKEKEIIKHIKNYSLRWAKITSNTWVIKTDEKINNVRYKLSNILTLYQDKLFVCDITKSAWASYCIPNEVTTFIK